MVLYLPELKGETLKKEQKKLKTQIESLGGSIVSESDLGLKNLAYEMNKQTQANFFVVVVELDPKKVEDLTLWLKREEKTVLRSLITKVNSKDTETEKKS